MQDAVPNILILIAGQLTTGALPVYLIPATMLFGLGLPPRPVGGRDLFTVKVVRLPEAPLRRRFIG